MTHPLAGVLREAAAGRFPPADGAVARLAPWRRGVEAVVCLTGHAYLCLAPDAELPSGPGLRPLDGYGGAADPRLVAALASRDLAPGERADVDSLDVLLAADGTGDPLDLVARPDLEDHPRADFARGKRDAVTVWGPPTGAGLVTRGHGVAGLVEVSVELPTEERGRGAGRALAAASRGLVDPGATVLAMVAPGNASSLRAFLGAGFTPLGSAQLWHPATRAA